MDIVVERTFAGLELTAETLASLDAKGYKAPTDCPGRELSPALSWGGTSSCSRARGPERPRRSGFPSPSEWTPGGTTSRPWSWPRPGSSRCRCPRRSAEIGRGRGIRVLSVYGGDSMDRQLEGHPGGSPRRSSGRRAGSSITCAAGPSSSTRSRSWSWTRRTACSTWASRSRWARSWSTCPRERQTLLFSATVPLGIRGLIYHYLSDPEWVLLSEDQIYVKEVEHLYCLTPKLHKEATLYKLLEYENPASSMIFCNTREETRQVSTFLAGKGLAVAMLSSDLPQKKRERVMARFKGGRDPAPGHDRRGLARDRHRGPVPRLHLLDARLAGAVHPPRGPHGAGGEERPCHQPRSRPTT